MFSPPSNCLNVTHPCFFSSPRIKMKWKQAHPLEGQGMANTSKLARPGCQLFLRPRLLGPQCPGTQLPQGAQHQQVLYMRPGSKSRPYRPGPGLEPGLEPGLPGDSDAQRGSETCNVNPNQVTQKSLIPDQRKKSFPIITLPFPRSLRVRENRAHQ